MTQRHQEAAPPWISGPSNSHAPSPELKQYLEAALRTLRAQVRHGAGLPEVTTDNMYRHLGSMPSAPEVKAADPPELEAAPLEDLRSFVNGLLLAEERAQFDELE